MKRVIYIYSNNLLKESSRNPPIKNRYTLLHNLLKHYGLFNEMTVKEPGPCSDVDLRKFHSLDYIECLKSTSEDVFKSSYFREMNHYEDFGLNYDSPKFPGLYEYALAIAGGTLTAADELVNGRAEIAINWFGGWHHAQMDTAGGYCYINDIALGLLKLQEKFKRILYIDLDVHHGDGVETAFSTTKHVFTLSFHQHEPGFYPGTGSVFECGFGPGLGYAANFPYKFGMSGDNFKKYFERTFETIFALYQPEVFVVQCGADVIAGDPLGGANIIPEDIEHCIKLVLNENLPTMFLGGGGYNMANTSRYWTYLTSVICQKKIPVELPQHEYLHNYGPHYRLNIPRRDIDDNNEEVYLNSTLKQISENLKKCQVNNM